MSRREQVAGAETRASRKSYAYRARTATTGEARRAAEKAQRQPTDSRPKSAEAKTSDDDTWSDVRIENSGKMKRATHDMAGC